MINSSQYSNTTKNATKQEINPKENNYSLLCKKKNPKLNVNTNIPSNDYGNNNSFGNTTKHYLRSINVSSLHKNNLSLFPILEDDEIRGDIYS